MRIEVNGESVDVEGEVLEDILEELGHGGTRVATAINAEFVPAPQRGTRKLAAGDRLEIVAPRQGG